MVIKVGHLELGVEERELGPDLLGEFDEMTCTIRVRPNISEQLRRSTILHECLHAISSIYGLDLTESQVLVLESSLTNLINQNPELFR